MPWENQARAKRAREDVPFPGSRARNQQIPRSVAGAKSHFWGGPVLQVFSDASEGSRSEFWNGFWRVPGPLSVFSDKGFAQYVKKYPLRPFLGAKMKGLPLQNHANRTVHPSKIEGEL